MAFRLPEVTRCCFVFRLRSGALIIAYLTGVAALFNALSTITLLVLVSRVASDRPANSSASPGVPTIDRATALRIYITYGVHLLVLVLHWALSIMLVIGVHKNIPRYLRLYFFVGGINLILNLVMICLTALFNGFYVTFGQLLASVIQFYFLLVIRSAHLEMVSRLKPPEELEMGAHPATAPPGRAPAAPLIPRD